MSWFPWTSAWSLENQTVRCILCNSFVADKSLTLPKFSGFWRSVSLLYVGGQHSISNRITDAVILCKKIYIDWRTAILSTSIQLKEDHTSHKCEPSLCIFQMTYMIPEDPPSLCLKRFSVNLEVHFNTTGFACQAELSYAYSSFDWILYSLPSCLFERWF